MKEVIDLGSEPRLSTNPMLSEGSREGFQKEGAPDQGPERGEGGGAVRRAASWAGVLGSVSERLEDGR